MKVGEHKTVYRKCPFCKDNEYRLDKWGDNFYLVKCLNRNTSAADWFKIEWRPHLVKVQIDRKHYYDA
jgi:hypothetical protein